MLIEGWDIGAKAIDATIAIKKHTGLSLYKAKKLVERILEGETIELPNDFVLRDDLRDAGFIVR
jgi:ribosomal protein L7/L12